MQDFSAPEPPLSNALSPRCKDYDPVEVLETGDIREELTITEGALLADETKRLKLGKLRDISLIDSCPFCRLIHHIMSSPSL